MKRLMSAALFFFALGFCFAFVPMIIYDALIFLNEVLVFAQMNFWLIYGLHVIFALTYIAFNLRGRKVVDPNAVLEAILESNRQILKTLDSIEQALRPEGTAIVVEFYQKINGVLTKVDNMFLKVDQVADLAVAFKDKLGNPAKIDGLPSWALTDESLAKLEISADGLSAVLSPVAVGAFKVQVKADADLGEGVREIIGELDVEISPLEAEIVEISATIRP